MLWRWIACARASRARETATATRIGSVEDVVGWCGGVGDVGGGVAGEGGVASVCHLARDDACARG